MSDSVRTPLHHLPEAIVESAVTLVPGAEQISPVEAPTLPHVNLTAQSAAPSRISIPGYEILGELGRGGMGVDYKARHKGLDRLVALKMILAGQHVSEADLARFRLEATAVAHVQHPNIVQIHEIGEAEGQPHFSLEFVAGVSLASRLQGTPLPARDSA
jgi:serine/threonine protein kinase